MQQHAAKRRFCYWLYIRVGITLYKYITELKVYYIYYAMSYKGNHAIYIYIYIKPTCNYVTHPCTELS